VLGSLKRVGKQLIVYGSNNGSNENGMKHLAGLESLEVGGLGLEACMEACRAGGPAA
jgi:hypothetical protein